MLSLHHCEDSFLKLSSRKRDETDLTSSSKPCKSFHDVKSNANACLAHNPFKVFARVVLTHLELLFPFKPLTHPMVHFIPHESSLKLFPQPILICNQHPTHSIRTISYPTTSRKFPERLVWHYHLLKQLTNAQDGIVTSTFHIRDVICFQMELRFLYLISS